MARTKQTMRKDSASNPHLARLFQQLGLNKLGLRARMLRLSRGTLMSNILRTGARIRDDPEEVARPTDQVVGKGKVVVVEEEDKDSFDEDAPSLLVKEGAPTDVHAMSERMTRALRKRSINASGYKSSVKHSKNAEEEEEWVEEAQSWADKVEIDDYQAQSQLDVEKVKLQAKCWESTIVCMVLGANPPIAVFEGFIRRIWGNLGIAQIARMNGGCTIMEFNDVATRDHVLENGIVQFDHKSVIIRPWSSDLNAIRLVKSVPLWIRLYDLGLHYWGSNCLSVLVSTIGKPIMTNKVTKERTMVKFARILVKMEIMDAPPRIIEYVNEYGRLEDQGVEYEWLPTKCKKCGGFGHGMADCRKEGSSKWMKKEGVVAKKEKKENGTSLATVQYKMSKINWLKKRDDCTAYFYACLKKRREENRITSFVDEQGKLIENYSDVVNHYVNHFKNFMGSKSIAFERIDADCLKMGNILNLYQQLELIRPFIEKEIKAAMFSILSTKSSGPDVYNSKFFKVLWLEIGGEVSKAILAFSKTGNIPCYCNKTTITLVPKTEISSKVVDYRPIACCTTIYKCITKLMCKRLEKIFPSLIDLNQGAFIKQREIAYNILILQDLVKNYGRKNVSPRSAVKVNLSKAYDTVDWRLMEELLVGLNFPSRFVRWVMACLEGSTYSVVLNERLQRSFKEKKGLRQGDPLSPLIFVIIMDYLTKRLKLEATQNTFKYHPLCKNLNLVSLYFADDLILSKLLNISKEL
uniref:Reverse transcriptase domain-containing protein n=1 Tax=Cannabis sativa TaxID=3483 RepID=A0A803PY04_CANSA